MVLPDFDAARARLQNIIREGIQPRIPIVEIRAVEGFADGPVVIVRVSQSWRAPHMVVFSGSSRFYIRDAGQRHVMDVQELRAAFVGSEGMATRIRDFRDERVARVLARSTPVPVSSGPTLLLHLVPVGASFARSDVDPRRVGDHWLKLMQTEFVPAPTVLINFEGFLMYASPDSGDATESPAYIQLFRNGAIEVLKILRPNHQGHFQVNGRELEQRIVSLIDALRQFRSDLDLREPIVLCLSLLRFQRVALYVGEPFLTMGRGLNRELVLLPDVLFDNSASPETSRIIRPVLDVLWQTAGFQGSRNYNDQGDWIPAQK